jgi:hypothetical protein
MIQNDAHAWVSVDAVLFCANGVTLAMASSFCRRSAGR